MHCGFTALPEKPLKSGNLKIIQPGVASVAHTSHIHCRYVYIYCIIYAIYVLYASLRYSSLLMHTMHAKSSSLLTSPHHNTMHMHACIICTTHAVSCFPRSFTYTPSIQYMHYTGSPLPTSLSFSHRHNTQLHKDCMSGINHQHTTV